MSLLPSSWSRRHSGPAQLLSLDTHPNRAEIVAIRRRAPLLRDAEVTRLALGWRNTPYLAAARARALAPDSPLIVEVLAAFDGVDAAFDDVLARQEVASHFESASWTQNLGFSGGARSRRLVVVPKWPARLGDRHRAQVGARRAGCGIRATRLAPG